MPHAPGTIIGGRHRIESLLGQGGFGAVFRATQLALDRPVALKVLLPEALGEESLKRFQREAEIVQRLEHPNIVRLLDFGVGAGAEPYLVFELLEGQTLEEAIRRGGPLSPARAARVGTQVLKALMEAHARGVVHRDIKPANIFLCDFPGEPDFVKVLDFGIAKGRDSRTLTGQGGVVGTPAYMAPEQVNGAQVTFAADLFALGLTLEEALTGKVVYGGYSLVDIVREHLSPAAVPHAPEVLSSPLGSVIQRATMKPPELRYPSAAEMLADLEAAMNGARGSAHVVVPAAGAMPSNIGYLPTVQPGAAPGYPSMAATPSVLVPAPPPPPRRRKRAPWALFAALGGGLALLGGGLAAVLALTADRAKEPQNTASAAAPPARAENVVHWPTLRLEGSLAEVDANGDAVPDFVVYCGDVPVQGPLSLCAVDGATFRILWRRPLGVENTMSERDQLDGSGRGIVRVDVEGIAHVHDAATGVERAAHRLGAHATLLCAPPEMPGKVWIRTADNRGVLVDTAARTASDAPRPASCRRGRHEFGCAAKPGQPVCAKDVSVENRGELEENLLLTEGSGGVAVCAKKRDPTFRVLVGFDGRMTSGREIVFDDAKAVWKRPVAPGDGLGAVGHAHSGDFDLRAGRAVTAYDDPKGKTHLVAVSAADGRTSWDVVTPNFDALVLSPTRVYLSRWDRLDIYDAATGRLLGAVGPER